MMSNRRLVLVLILLSFPVMAYLQSYDIDYDFDPTFEREVQCSENVTLHFNDKYRRVSINCNQTKFDTQMLRKCSDYLQFRVIGFFNCLLPSPDMDQVLGSYRPECLIVHSNISWNHEEIIVRNLSHLHCLALSITTNVTYKLQNLQNLNHFNLFRLRQETLPENFFFGLNLLRIARVADGEIRYLPAQIFNPLSRILAIYLDHNRLEELPENIFDELKILEIIDLSNNHLSTLPAGIFRKLFNLKNLFINSNKFTQLPSVLVHYNINLKFFSIGNNSISVLAEDFLQNSTLLDTFEACQCNISELPEIIFSFSPLLTNIHLCENRLGSLHRNLFFRNKWLKVLSLSDNRLTSLHSDIFSNNYWMNSVDLSRNMLDSIHRNTFPNSPYLSFLSLSKNKLINIEESFFSRLEYLKILWLDDNSISSLPSQRPFGISRNLSYIDLSRNNLIQFPKLDWSAYNISFLNLSYNLITSVREEDLPPSEHVRVSLWRNQIATVHVTSKYEYTQNVNFSDNPFCCDCHLRNFVNAIRMFNVKSLLCASPPKYANTSLTNIIPSYVLCPYREDCPNSCRCYRAKDLTIIVNCSSSNMHEVPLSLPPNTSIVYLTHNFLSDIRNIENWWNVTRLSLDYNRLDPSRSWNLPINLKFLSLRHNRLNFLSEKFLKIVSGLPLLRLDIRNNQFWCNCSFLYFKHWFDQNIDRIIEPGQIMCNRLFLNNDTKVASPFIGVPPDAFCPSYSSILNIPLVVSSSITSFLALIIFISFVIFLKYKKTILAYLYVHFPCFFCFNITELDSDKLYDAFVSYTGSDQEIVFAILQELEEKFPFFKLCIHERDWLPGYPIISQIENSIQNSRKTIIILSEEFLNSVWCETEFQMAYLQCLEEKVDRLIIVINGKMPTSDKMPLDMQKLLDTKTYIVWGERWFWEKLRYSLPHYSHQKPPEYQLRVVDKMIEDLRNKNSV